MRLGRRAGFSLIEMMFVCLVVGVLTLIALPRIREMKRRAYVTTLTHDIRNLANTEELYWEDAGVYTTNLVDLKFQASLDVDVTIVEASASGFSARAEHTPSGTFCTAFYGSAAPVPPATIKAEIACDWP